MPVRVVREGDRWDSPSPVAGLADARFEHVAPTPASLVFNLFVQVQQRRDRNFESSLSVENGGEIAALDPPSDPGMTDAEQLRGEALRNGFTELLLE